MSAKKLIRRLVKRFIVIGIVGYFFWQLPALFIITGVYDCLRQKNKNKGQIFQLYFLGNGTLAWLFSPLNFLIDIISLPYINKQVYQLEDLPKKHQEEIKTILEECPNKYIEETLNKQAGENERNMLFYKWYGFNVDNNYPCELFHRKFKRVLTIGVSSFNAQAQTNSHFGWLRAGVRVLINVYEDVSENAWIDVNNNRHSWKKDGPLFIFDDTVLHQAVNHSDKIRNNLFIDITRPTLFPFLINGLVKTFGLITTKISFFSKLSKWKVVN